MSIDIRKKIINLHGKLGKSYREICVLLDIPKTTIARVIQRHKNEGRIGNGPRTGRPSEVTPRLKRILKRIVDDEPTLSARKIVTIMSEAHGLTVGKETVRKTILSFGYRSCVRRKKPFISKKNRKDRLEFAKKYLNEPRTENFIFQQDNDPKHTSMNARLFLTYNTPHQMKSPAQSPDLNPIEHLWEVLERRLRKHQVRSKPHLKELLLDEWSQIPHDTVRKLAMSMPNRLRAVIKAKGHATQY